MSTSLGLRWRGGIKRTMYQRKVDVDMLNAVKSMFADVSSISPSSEQTQGLCSVCRPVSIKQFVLNVGYSELYGKQFLG